MWRENDAWTSFSIGHSFLLLELILKGECDEKMMPGLPPLLDTVFFYWEIFLFSSAIGTTITNNVFLKIVKNRNSFRNFYFSLLSIIRKSVWTLLFEFPRTFAKLSVKYFSSMTNVFYVGVLPSITVLPHFLYIRLQFYYLFCPFLPVIFVSKGLAKLINYNWLTLIWSTFESFPKVLTLNVQNCTCSQLLNHLI